MRRTLTGALALVLALSATTSGAQDLGRNSTTWTWDGKVEAGNWFRLLSINGPVSVEASTDNMVHVRAEKVVKRGDVTDVAFQVIQKGGDVQVCAVRRRDTCDDNGLQSHDNRDNRDDRRDVQVRFTVKVPAGVRVRASTVNGEMKIRDVTSDVRASTVNGRVEVTNAGGPVKANTVNGGVNVTTRNGPVEANTVNGSIDVRMNALSRDGDMAFNTVNGNVTVEMPGSLDAKVSLGTMHGSIESDYPVQLSGRFGPRHAEGTIGRGGREIKIDTVNGTVALRKIR